MSRSPVALLVLAVALPLSAADLTPGQKAYLDGVNAYNGASYAIAAERIQAALREDGSEALKKIKTPESRLKEDYLPHYFLGLALEKLGKGDEARRELLESQRQGVVLSLPGSKRILEAALARVSAVAVARVEPTLPPPTPAPPTATPRPQAPAPTKLVAAPPPTATAQVRVAATPAAARPTPTAPTAPTPAGLDTAVAEAVRKGIRLYFDGDFKSAVDQLRPLKNSMSIARLFLSYALVAGQLLEKKMDPETLNEARSEYATAKAALSKTDLHDELVSRRVREALGGS